MAGAAIGQHPAPQALERTAATEQQARVFAPALDQKRQKCLMQDALTSMGLDAVDGAKRLAGRSIDRHDLAPAPPSSQPARRMRACGFLERGDELLGGVEHALQVAPLACST